MLDKKVNHALKAIGMPQLCQPIFYNAQIGIRFEISEPFSNAEISERIAVAFKRVSSIYHAALLILTHYFGLLIRRRKSQ